MSRMTEAGPRANRPPHWAFAWLSFRCADVSKAVMIRFRRRTLLAAGATLAFGPAARKPLAATGSLLPPKVEAPGAAVPEIHFALADGTARTLADYAGQGVVLNFWATWFVPCIEEMPALAVLADRLQGKNVVVLPLSSDRGGAQAVERFYREKEVEGLPVLLDARGDALHAMGGRGIPTTVLIDRNGHERGRLEGAADWGSDTALAAVQELGK